MAALRGAAVPRDREIVWALVALLAVDVVAVVFVSITHARPSGFLAFEVAIYFGALLCQSIPVLRLRFKPNGYSVTAFLWLVVTVGVFLIWNLLIMLVSVGTRLWEHAPPYGFDAAAALGVVPLVVSIWFLSAKVRTP